MQILNVGSVNIDRVYTVDHFVRPGETIASTRFDIFAGGKGFNQSVALARAGAMTRHAGRIGEDGCWLLERLRRENVDTTFLTVVQAATGHAVIQVTPGGENAIVLHGGANRELRAEDVAGALAACVSGDWVLTQNETSAVDEVLRLADSRGLRVAFNPAPMTAEVRDYALSAVDLLILNETEAEILTGATDPATVRLVLQDIAPKAAVALTLGRAGVVYWEGARLWTQPAFEVHAVDTTAAGDTFIGYFLAERMRGGDPSAALALACRAAAICVGRPGAADSIPVLAELRGTTV